MRWLSSILAVIGLVLPAFAETAEEAYAKAGSAFDRRAGAPLVLLKEAAAAAPPLAGSAPRPPVVGVQVMRAGFFARSGPPKPKSMEERLGCLADHSKGGALWGSAIGGAFTGILGLFRGGLPKAARWGAVGATGAGAYGAADGGLGSMSECDAWPSYRWIWPQNQ